MDKRENNDLNKSGKYLVWIGFILYVFITGGKNVYTAELVTLMDVFNATKAQITLATTYYFVTYAVAQVILLFIMSKLNLRTFITISAMLTGVAIVVIGTSTSLTAIYVIQALNGFLSAGIYIGIMAALSKSLPAELLPYSNKIMSLGGAIYNVLSYGLSALFVGFGMWRTPFIITGIGSVIFGILFFLALGKMKKFNIEKVEREDKKDEPIFTLKGKKDLLLYYVIFIVIALFSNVPYYCIFVYVPNLMKEVFAMPDSYSILITLIVPLGSSLFAVLSVSMCARRRNIFKVGVLFSFLCVIAIAMLMLLYSKNIILSLVLVIAVIGLRAASSTVVSSVLAFNMRKQVNTGSYLAAVNSVASLCAGIVPPIIGNLIDLKGYSASYLVALVAMALMFISLIFLSVNFNKKEKNLGNNL